MRLLLNAYPLLAVSEESCGGAEQVLVTLETELVRRKHQTTMAAAHGSCAAGSLLATGAPAREPDRLAEREQEHARHVLDCLRRTQASSQRFDLVHDHSGSFWRHAAEIDTPVLATLHLPRHFYPADAFQDVGLNVLFNCVSESQRRSFADMPHMAGVVSNGVRVQEFPFRERKDDYLLWLGRICEEKGTHVAIRVARAAGAKLVIAGGVYPFSYHQRYFEREVVPWLNSSRGEVYYIERPTKTEKLRLLGGAQALLVTSLVDETSSLVAMEAMACGTPVLAFRRGALPEIVNEGVTGFLAADEAEMARAVAQAESIDPAKCRAHAEESFSSERMASDYEALYARVLGLVAARYNKLAARP